MMTNELVKKSFQQNVLLGVNDCHLSKMYILDIFIQKKENFFDKKCFFFVTYLILNRNNFLKILQ